MSRPVRLGQHPSRSPTHAHATPAAEADGAGLHARPPAAAAPEPPHALGVAEPHAARRCRRGRRPYSRTGPWPQLPCTFGAWAVDLENQISRQRVDGIQILLRFRVRLSEYYNFGRIEPG